MGEADDGEPYVDHWECGACGRHHDSWWVRCEGCGADYKFKPVYGDEDED